MYMPVREGEGSNMFLTKPAVWRGDGSGELHVGMGVVLFVYVYVIVVISCLTNSRALLLSNGRGSGRKYKPS